MKCKFALIWDKMGKLEDNYLDDINKAQRQTWYVLDMYSLAYAA